MSGQPFHPRSFADALREAEARAAEMGLPHTAGPARQEPAADYDREWGVCPCGRHAPAFELVDVSGVEEVPGTYACCGCRGTAFRSGTISPSEFARKVGAPAGMVDGLRRAETRRASHTTPPAQEKKNGNAS
ncbi:MAG TPA: hypothetical protein VF263_10020 [Longimicrobiaceae bacterium]